MREVTSMRMVMEWRTSVVQDEGMVVPRKVHSQTMSMRFELACPVTSQAERVVERHTSASVDRVTYHVVVSVPESDHIFYHSKEENQSTTEAEIGLKYLQAHWMA